MDFRAYAARELTALADKLADTAQKELDATTVQLSASFEATIARLRTDQLQLVNDNQRLTAENAALLWEKQEMLEAAKTSGRGPLIDRLADVFGQLVGSKTIDEAL